MSSKLNVYEHNRIICRCYKIPPPAELKMDYEGTEGRKEQIVSSVSNGFYYIYVSSILKG